jgi:hypothetical protein
MTSLNRTRILAAAALALGALGAATVAQARDNVSFFVGVQSPGYYQQAPVYSQPQPVYSYTTPAYVAPTQYYVQPAAPVYRYGYEAERARREEWRRREWLRHHQWEQHHGHGYDRDHDRRWD